MRDDSLFIPTISVFAVLFGLVAWPFIAIVIHELGHALAGKLVGLTPSHFVVGYPDDGGPVLSFRVFGCVVDCWPLPFGGATFFKALPSNGAKLFILTMGGPLMDILVVLGCLLLWRYAFIRLGLFFVIVSQSLDILCNLIPRSFLYDGVRVHNDSKIILRLLAGRRQA